MRRWLVLLLLLLISTTGCAAAGGLSGGGLNLNPGGSSGAARPKPTPPPPEATLAGGSARATLLADGGEILPALLDAIQAAKKRVDVEMYEFGDPRLSDALLAAVKRGVQLRVILDGTEQQSQAMAQQLQAKKVAVRIFQVSGGIDHVKLLVADETVIIGGMNWGKSSMLNHDYDVLIKSAPAEFDALFERDWGVAGGEKPAGPAGDYLLYDANIRSSLLKHLREAQRAVWLELDELSDPEIIQALFEAAGRGVDVRVLLDPNVANNQETATKLVTADIGVRWWYTDAGRLHAKALLIDEQHLIVGSANLTQRGLSINHEADVDLHAPALASRLRDIFDADWKKAVPAMPGAA